VNNIRCEVVAISTDTGVCSGIAKTRLGEVYELDGRTPAPVGMCCQALGAMNATRLAMAVTARGSEVREPLETTCPHGVVKFRLSRIP
jgi:hypothetical protein